MCLLNGQVFFFNRSLYYLLYRENQESFRNLQGIELMIRLIRELNFSSKLALKVVSYALNESPYNCRHFIDSLGLKFLFPVFMKKGIKGKNKEEQMLVDGFFI